MSIIRKAMYSFSAKWRQMTALKFATLGIIMAMFVSGCEWFGSGGRNFTFKLPQYSNGLSLSLKGGLLAAVNPKSHSVSFFKVKGKKVKFFREVGVGTEPFSLAFHPRRGSVYVSNTADQTVVEIPTRGDHSFSVGDVISVGAEPRGLAITPNGKRIYVANHTGRSISVIDTTTNEVIQTIPIDGWPWWVAITNDRDKSDFDEKVYTSNFFGEFNEDFGGTLQDNLQVTQAFEMEVFSFEVERDVTNLPAINTIELPPIAQAGFTADRRPFCVANGAVNDTFCQGAANDAFDEGAFPNLANYGFICGDVLYMPMTGSQPEPPVNFANNVQALLYQIDTENDAFLRVQNVNAQISDEQQPDPAQGSLDRTFLAGFLSFVLDRKCEKGYALSSFGDYVLHGDIIDDLFDIGAAEDMTAERWQTGLNPTSQLLSMNDKLLFVYNRISRDLTVIDAENKEIIDTLASSEPPAPGSWEHVFDVGDLAFHTSIGVPGNGRQASTLNLDADNLFNTPIRDIDPYLDRNRASDNGWSSCASCHPYGLHDNVTWSFATGPRQTISLDAFFHLDSPAGQRVSNWNAVRGSITDFNNNSRNVQGGEGFAGPIDPMVGNPDQDLFNHGRTEGLSDALDAQTVWVQAFRKPLMPQDGNAADIAAGRTLFEEGNGVDANTECFTCHGGEAWTSSQVIYQNNPTFEENPVANAAATVLDPCVVNTGAQVQGMNAANAGCPIDDAAGQVLWVRDVGTFDAAGPFELRGAGMQGQGALGGIGFNNPSLLNLFYNAPFFHDGRVETLQDVWEQHVLPDAVGMPVIDDAFTETQQIQLEAFLNTIDPTTLTTTDTVVVDGEPAGNDTQAFLNAATP